MDEMVDVVIPTVSESVRTLESLPDDVTAHVERDGSLNEARNRGVAAARDGVVVIMDDDLAFTESAFRTLTDAATPDTVVGLADWDFGLLAGRCLVFYKQCWEDVGGFDERLGSHMGDTAFALAAKRQGYDLERIPREVLHHEPHSRSVTTWDRVWRLGYLSLRHPTASPTLAKGAIL